MYLVAQEVTRASDRLFTLFEHCGRVVASNAKCTRENISARIDFSDPDWDVALLKL